MITAVVSSDRIKSEAVLWSGCKLVIRPGVACRTQKPGLGVQENACTKQGCVKLGRLTVLAIMDKVAPSHGVSKNVCSHIWCSSCPAQQNRTTARPGGPPVPLTASRSSLEEPDESSRNGQASLLLISHLAGRAALGAGRHPKSTRATRLKLTAARNCVTAELFPWHWWGRLTPMGPGPPPPESR